MERDLIKKVEATFDSIIKSPGVLSALTTDADKVTESHVTPPKLKLVRVMTLIDKVAKAAAPHVVCTKGCDHCCKMSVTLSALEAEQIGRAIGVQPAHVKRLVSDMPDAETATQEQVTKFKGVPCVFLKDGACSIHSARPMACRAFFNLSGDASRCDLTKGDHTVPNIDFSKLWAAYASATLYSPFGDIREFFPYGLNPPGN